MMDYMTQMTTRGLTNNGVKDKDQNVVEGNGRERRAARDGRNEMEEMR